MENNWWWYHYTRGMYSVMKYMFVLGMAFAMPIHAQKFSACVTPRTSTIVATAGNIIDTTLVSVSTPTTIAPVLEENYTYSSVQAFTSTTRNSKVYAQSPIIGFEPTCNALQYSLTPNAANPVCDKYYMGYDLDFPQQLPEAYVEMWVKWDSSFALHRPAADTTACKAATPGQSYSVWSSMYGGSGVVLLMGRVNNQSGAFGLTLGSGWPWAMRADAGHPCYFADTGATKQLDENERHSCGYGLLSNQYTFQKGGGVWNIPGSYHVQGDARYTNVFSDKLMRFDKQWHRYRFWFKAANGVHPNGASISLWVDDTHLGTLNNRDTAADRLIGLSIGRFMWQQPIRSEFIQIGRVRVWSVNPGWNVCEAFCVGYP